MKEDSKHNIIKASDAFLPHPTSLVWSGIDGAGSLMKVE